MNRIQHQLTVLALALGIASLVVLGLTLVPSSALAANTEPTAAEATTEANRKLGASLSGSTVDLVTCWRTTTKKRTCYATGSYSNGDAWMAMVYVKKLCATTTKTKWVKKKKRKVKVTKCRITSTMTVENT